MLAEVYTILLFGNRKKQLRVVFFCIVGSSLLEIVEIATNLLSVKGAGIAVSGFIPGALFLPGAIVFLYLASKAIKKDEELVRSVDRLR